MTGPHPKPKPDPLAVYLGLGLTTDQVAEATNLSVDAVTARLADTAFLCQVDRIRDALLAKSGFLSTDYYGLRNVLMVLAISPNHRVQHHAGLALTCMIVTDQLRAILDDLKFCLATMDTPIFQKARSAAKTQQTVTPESPPREPTARNPKKKSTVPTGKNTETGMSPSKTKSASVL